jgi:hypothetical protein
MNATEITTTATGTLTIRVLGTGDGARVHAKLAADRAIRVAGGERGAARAAGPAIVVIAHVPETHAGAAAVAAYRALVEYGYFDLELGDARLETTPSNDVAPVAAPVETPAPAPVTLATTTVDATAAETTVVATSWTASAWANHIADARHEIHAANSYARHLALGEMGPMAAVLEIVTIARMVAFDHMDAERARALIGERVAARLGLLTATPANDVAAA